MFRLKSAWNRRALINTFLHLSSEFQLNIKTRPKTSNTLGGCIITEPTIWSRGKKSPTRVFTLQRNQELKSAASLRVQPGSVHANDLQLNTLGRSAGRLGRPSAGTQSLCSFTTAHLRDPSATDRTVLWTLGRRAICRIRLLRADKWAATTSVQNRHVRTQWTGVYTTLSESVTAVTTGLR